MPTTRRRSTSTPGRAVLVAALLVVTAACGGGDGGGSADAKRDAGIVAPTFAPLDGDDAPTAETTAPPASPSSIVLGGTDAVPETTPPSTAAAPTAAEASVGDPEGDATPSPIDPPPAWSDLIGARLVRTDAGFELRVRVAGGRAPETSDGGHTMNVASFFEVDGDGEVDYEVWANVADGGWGGSYFDDRNGTSDYLEDSGVSIRTEGDEVVIAFPHGHLADAATFRWAVASEWGRYEAIGTPAAVRDDVPDQGAVTFPAQ